MSKSNLWSRLVILGILPIVAAGVLFRRREVSDEVSAGGLQLSWEVPDFTLTNCTGEKVARSALLGKIWVANFIFTRCPGPCPLMTQRMRSLQEDLEKESGIYFVSITVDPEYDTSDVLKEYAEHWKADLSNWYFLTGTKEETLELVVKGFLVAASNPDDSAASAELIVHGTKFLLVDSRGRVRASYDYADPGLQDHVLKDIGLLRQEN